MASHIDSAESYDAERVRNRIGRSQLAKQIEKIDKEERSDLRMLQTSKSQFHLKFLKYEPIPPTTGSQVKNVRMYETHNPGFCYRRNGDIRNSQFSPTDNESQCFQEVRELLFSNNEIDIEKVLCLHLLAAHSFIKRQQSARTAYSASAHSRTSAISSLRLNTSILGRKKTSLRDCNNPTRSFLASPIQQLKREILAKKHQGESGSDESRQRSTKLLPAYVIDLKRRVLVDEATDADSEDEYWGSISNEEIEIKRQNLDEESEDFNLDFVQTAPPPAIRVLTKNEVVKQECNVPLHVNKQIEKLVDSVVEILQEVNPVKVQHMVRLARQPSTLKKILKKPEIQEFIEKLSGKPIMSDSGSFHVSPARVVTIREKVSSLGELPSDMKELGVGGEEWTAVNLEIADTTINLEKLVNEIRKNVLQEATKLQPEDTPSLPPGSWRKLYRSSGNTLVFKAPPRTRATQESSQDALQEIEIAEVNFENFKTDEQREDTNSTIRVSKSPNINEREANRPQTSGFSLASYSGFTKTLKRTPSGHLSLDSAPPKEVPAVPEGAKRKKTASKEDKAKKRPKPTVKRPESRGAPKLKTDDPFSVRKVTCPVCKKRPIVIHEIENTQRYLQRKCKSILASSSFNIVEEIEKPYKEFKKHFLNDDFFKTRGLEDLLKMAAPSNPKSARDDDLWFRVESDNYPPKGKSTTWDMIRLNQTVPSYPLLNQREQVEQLLLQKMTANERTLVFRKLATIKSQRMHLDNYQNLEPISFASYVVPVLSKKSIMRLLEGVEGRVKDIVSLPASKGGLGLYAYFSGYSNDVSNLQGSSKKPKEVSEEVKVNSHLTVMDLEHLKFEIAQKETHKKYLDFLNKKIP